MATRARAIGGRRRFLRGIGAVAGASWAATVEGTTARKVELPPIKAPTEGPERTPEPADPPGERVGFALVGLGRLTLGELVPAFGRTRHCRPVALVSGDRAKARRVAEPLGVPERAIYDYEGFDRIADDPAIQVVYVVLPNSMHAEYSIRAARAGKHVLCEKPMATTAADCERMIEASRKAQRRLMVAYRSQYEPMSIALGRMVRDKALGPVREFVSGNSQNTGDPSQWRLKRDLAGGGPLPDMGIYCINGVRFLSGEEPTEAVARLTSSPGDPRFKEVEEAAQFVLKFPSGLSATCLTSYATHRAQFLRFQGPDGWAEMDPAYAYRGLRLRIGRFEEGVERTTDLNIEPVDQFAAEMDHFAQCIRQDRPPRTPGEEGLQDVRIVEAIYESARSGRPVRIPPPAGPTRGPEPS